MKNFQTYFIKNTNILKYFGLILFLFSSVQNFAQQNFADTIKYSENVEFLRPNSKYIILSSQDSLAIIKKRQLKEAIIKATSLEICDLQVILRQQKIDTLNLLIDEKNSTINLLESERERYQQIYDTCYTDIEKMSSMMKNQQTKTRIAIIAGGILVIIAFFAGGYILP